jgi:plastocyanin
MKGKILILFVVLVALFISGCSEKNTTPAPVDSNNSMPKADITEPTEPKENANSGSGTEHIVRLENYGVVKPSELGIPKGDLISFWSDKRQGNYVLVSEDKLFPDEKLSYRVPFKYTFNEAGTYRFSVKDMPQMNLTLRVS